MGCDKMSKFKKYIKGGSINPFWVREQMGEFDDNNNSCNTSSNISISISISTGNDYDQQFEFLKEHSNSPEDLALAKSILGLE